MLSMEANNDIFNNALSSFVKDFACKNEIIAKLNKKKPISQIKNELLFPISEESIAKIIWEYLVEKSIILLYEPGDTKNEQYEFVRKTDSIGKTHYEQVKIKPSNKNDYILLNLFEIKSNKTLLDSLDNFKKELVLKLPCKQKSIYIKTSFWK